MTDSAALDMLLFALNFERDGERFYREAAELTTDRTGKRMFTKLAADEHEHARWIEQSLQSLRDTGSFPHPGHPALPPDLADLRPPAFPSAEAYAGARPNAHEIDALKRGVRTEEESRDFYAQAAERIADPDGRALLAGLSEVEEGHRVLLQGELDYLTKTGMYFGRPDFSLEAMVE